MSKKSKEIILYVITFIAIFIAPLFLINYFQQRDNEMFYKWVTEDYELCMKHAKEDSRDAEWCGEIRDAAKLSYRNAGQYSDPSFLLLFFAPILFVMLYTIRNLRKQVEELKAKIDV